MKRASLMGAYRNAKDFPMPHGITQARICLGSGKLAADQCVNTRAAYFVSGTEPTEKCDLHGGEPEAFTGDDPVPLDITQTPDPARPPKEGHYDGASTQ